MKNSEINEFDHQWTSALAKRKRLASIIGTITFLAIWILYFTFWVHATFDDFGYNLYLVIGSLLFVPSVWISIKVIEAIRNH